MGEGERDAQHRKDVGEPVPRAGDFDNGVVGFGELAELLLEPERRAGDAGLFDARAVRPVGCDDAVRRVLVDPGVPPGSALLG